MNRLTSAGVRQSFLEFFKSKGHLVMPSASLVPIDDPTLLFTNAGMNQFKNSFLGLSAPPASRVADAQKCMRVSGKHNDLEDVGPSPYHHTFFEMLGNWSFGDYYKQEAISWAWELLTDVWGFPGDRLYATVFEDDKGEIPFDEEAVRYWQNRTNIDHSHILYFGRKDNFWEMAETGPCGPNSEIHFDRGLEFCDKKYDRDHKCQVNGDCTRFLEIWNLVFIQYNSLGNGSFEPLPAKHVDTGAGFERLVMVMQLGRSNYDTDLFTPIFGRIRELAFPRAVDGEDDVVSQRVIADHSRAAAFLIGDGVLPGNVGRGYVLRMVIRRAARFGRKLGFTRPFLAEVADTVIETMGNHYRELRDRREHILTTITQEEERFFRTLDQGLSRLDQLLSQLPVGTLTLAGGDAFDLYATYGLPLEITRDVVGELGYTVDIDGFQQALTDHREMSSGSALEAFGAELAQYAELLDHLVREGTLAAEGVVHDPYGPNRVQASIVALLRKGERVSKARPGDEIEIVLSRTPFYFAAGGQVSDTGLITAVSTEQGDLLAASEYSDASIWNIQIDEVKRPLPGLILHQGKVLNGEPQERDLALAQVDIARRLDIRRNHTATHLLHLGLRQVLGNHVQQAGSLVEPDRLRFDFTHHTSVSRDELKRISRLVNENIVNNYPLDTSHERYDRALESGVIALFGEKYGDVVRVVRIGNKGEYISQELCGGTHVNGTGDISQFRVVSEGSVGAGLRRIEAVTGRAAHRLTADQLQVLESAARYLECQPEEVDNKAKVLVEEMDAARKEIDRLHQAMARRDFERLISEAQILDGMVFLSAPVETREIDTLRQMTDWFRDRFSSGVVVLGAVIDGRPHLVAAVTSDLVQRGLRADELVRSIAHIVGGGGGGQPTLAQAGGRDASRLSDALSSAQEFVAEKLG